MSTALVYDEQSLELVITDDGIGFGQESIERHTGAGIRSMRRRANRLGDIFKIVHASGNTVLTVHIPRRAERPEEEKLAG